VLDLSSPDEDVSRLGRFLPSGASLVKSSAVSPGKVF
jgi:hypothetical protein